MLLRLDIENIAIIKKSALTFGSGLTVFTGQTGAGKSILLDALSLCLGARADSDLIRHGEDRAVISAAFDIDQRHLIDTILTDHGLPIESTELVIRRVLVRDGNSRCFLNDYPVSLNLVKLVANHLMEIHQQFDRMLDAASHRGVLDEYARHDSLLLDTKNAFQAWKNTLEALEAQHASIDAALREQSFLEHKVKELKAFDPQQNEEQALTEQRAQLKQKEALTKTYKQVVETFGGDFKTAVLQSLKAIGKFEDVQSVSLAEQMESVVSDMTEVAAKAEEHLHLLLDHSMSLNDIEDRLFELRHLSRKYHCLPDELPETLKEAERLLSSLEASSKNIQALEAQVEQTRAAFIEVATRLSQQRQAKARSLDEQIRAELPPLKLGQARFVTYVNTLNESDWGVSGMDAVEFMVDMNKQGVLLPLNKVASGGEMARLMLALKVCLARSGSTPGLVFDEVDSGVGGDVANAVGQRLKQLAEHLQVLVITHSPQVASLGDTHWVINKTMEADEVETTAALLTSEQRISEIARMLSGDVITPEAKAAASVLLQHR
jgi:DNA repair protein RecN (Recombination protein N)